MEVLFRAFLCEAKGELGLLCRQGVEWCYWLREGREGGGENAQVTTVKLSHMGCGGVTL